MEKVMRKRTGRAITLVQDEGLQRERLSSLLRDEDERHYCVIGIPSPTRKFSLVVRIIDLGIPKGFANPL